MAKIASLFVKVGALVFVIVLPTKYAIDLQLLGGVWILQTLPAVAIGLYTRWLDARAMLVGWAAGMAWGTYMAFDLDFKGSVFKVFGINAYEALWGLRPEPRRDRRAHRDPARDWRRRQRGRDGRGRLRGARPRCRAAAPGHTRAGPALHPRARCGVADPALLRRALRSVHGRSSIGTRTAT